MQSAVKKKRGRRRRDLPSSDSPCRSLDPAIFSAMPRDSLGHVFSLLPIKDSVRAGTVCRGFRHAWQLNRKLDFDQEFAAGLTWREIVNTIDHVVTLHVGREVSSFRLWKFDTVYVGDDVRRWIRIVIAKNVEELDLDFVPTARPVKFSRDCLDIESLKVLKLSSCEIDVQRPLKGLRLLKTVVLNQVCIDEAVIEILIDHCRLLETFELTFCRNIRQLKVLASDHTRLRVLKLSSCPDISTIEIDAPKLATFLYRGKLPEFSLRNVMGLKDALLIFIPSKGYLNHSLVKKNILHAVTQVKTFTINSTFLEGISLNTEDRRIDERQYTFENLMELQIHLDPGTYCNTHDIATFILQCPKLERLFIDFDYCSFESGVYWELHQKQEIERSLTLDNLKTVKLTNFRFQKHQADLLKFLTTKAIRMERLAIFVPKWDKGTTTKEFRIPATGSCYDDFYESQRLTSAEKRVSYNRAEDDSSMQPFHSKWPQ